MHSKGSPSSSISFLHPMLITLLVLGKTQAVSSYKNNCLTAARGACSHTPIPYPFSLSQGCGHPGFQLRCSSDHKLLLKINGGIYRILGGLPDPDANQAPRITIADQNVHGALGKGCGLPNATFNSTASNFRVVRENYTEALTLLIDCPSASIAKSGLGKNLSQFRCKRKHRCYYASSPYPSANHLRVLTNACGQVVEVPVSRNGTGANNKKGRQRQRQRQQQQQPPCELLLAGFQVEWNTSDQHFQKCRGCRRSKGVCGYNDSQPFLCYCRSGIYLQDCLTGRGTAAGKRRRRKSELLGVVIGGGTGFLALIAMAATCAVIYWRKIGRPAGKSLEMDEPLEMAISSKSFNLPVFTYHELQVATDFFDERRQLGDGGFGRVYSAKLADGQTVAVKRLFPENSLRIEQFVNEIRILSTLCHPNLVRLIGFCQHRQDLFLVYEYVPNGTLADHLYGERRSPGQGLPWQTRLNIALQIARALEYLHFSVTPPVFHRDIKSSNILLDGEFGVKVADFGLCRLLSPLESAPDSTVPIGTPGYLDPDCSESYELTDKSDVYSFGVVLFEIVCGMRAVDPARSRREINLAYVAVERIQCGTMYEIVDPGLEIESDPLVRAMVGRVCEVGFGCLASKREDRPDMMEVVVQLEQINRIGCATSPGCVIPGGQPLP